MAKYLFLACVELGGIANYFLILVFRRNSFRLSPFIACSSFCTCDNHLKCVRILLIPKSRKIHSFLVVITPSIRVSDIILNNETDDTSYSYVGILFPYCYFGTLFPFYLIIIVLGVHGPHPQLSRLVSLYGRCLPWP